MKRVKFNVQTEINVKNIKGFMKRKVVISGTSAKVTCPKEYLNCEAILIILEDGTKKEDNRARKNNASSSNRDNAVKKRK